MLRKITILSVAIAGIAAFSNPTDAVARGGGGFHGGGGGSHVGGGFRGGSLHVGGLPGLHRGGYYSGYHGFYRGRFAPSFAFYPAVYPYTIYPYLGGYPIASDCYRTVRVHTRKGWRPHRVWVCD